MPLSALVPWGGRVPRAWQEAALPVLLAALEASPERRGVVRAVMGSGKSVLAAELVAVVLGTLGPAETVVVTTPRQFLVRQLWTTFAELLGPEVVGRFYADRKEPGRRVVIACNASAPALALELQRLGRTVALWVPDEAHGTESDGLKAACDALAPRRRIGFTATAYRAVRHETLSLFDEVLYDYGCSDAIRDGVIVPFDVVNWDGTGHNAKEVDAICSDLIRTHALGLGPGIVNSRGIEDCNAFVARLAQDGVRSAPVHSALDDVACHHALDTLRDGGLDCVTHVNMLSEGVDYPWLRWICLRRRVGSRVRFAQELGRALRAFPGKSRALVIDPYDLCREFDLETAAAVGLALERIPVEGLPVPERAEPEVPPAVAVQAVEAWARKLVLHLQEHGTAEADPSWDPTWRFEKATRKQVGALVKMAWVARYIPEPHRGAVKAVCREDGVAPMLPRGAASDLLTVLFTVARASEPMRTLARETQQFWRYRWDWPRRAGDGFEKVAAPALGRLRTEAA